MSEFSISDNGQYFDRDKYLKPKKNVSAFEGLLKDRLNESGDCHGSLCSPLMHTCNIFTVLET
jgi:hypothetical protein